MKVRKGHSGYGLQVGLFVNPKEFVNRKSSPKSFKKSEMNHQIFIDQKDGTKQLEEFVAC